MILIVDVAEFQNVVDWGRVSRAGIAGAIHKVTQYRVDYQHAANHAGIPAIGLPHGCYHFLNSDQDGTQQASFFLSQVELFGSGTFPPVVDFERYNGRLPSADTLDAFLRELATITPRRPLLYGNRGELATLGKRFVGRVDVWLADYGRNDGRMNGDPLAIRASTLFPVNDVKMWQYTSVGKVDGIGVLCDLSVWLGTQAEFDAYINPQSQVRIQSVSPAVPAGPPPSPAIEEELMPMLKATDPKNGCHALVDRDTGAVYCYNKDGSPGGHFLGGANRAGWNVGAGQPNGPVVAFEFFDDGNPAFSAYVIWTQGADGVPHSYSFPSSGVLK